MQARNITIVLAGLVVLGVVGVLLFQVRGDANPQLSEEKRARALAEYQRRQAATPPSRRAAPPPTAHRPRKWPTKKEEEEEESRPAPVRERRLPQRRLPQHKIERPQVDRPRPNVAAKKGDDDDNPVKARMMEATGFYDKGDYPAAQEVALEVLEKDPRNIKMLRVAVSTLCATGDVDRAAVYLERLPAGDKKQMMRRCRKWGAELDQ